LFGSKESFMAVTNQPPDTASGINTEKHRRTFIIVLVAVLLVVFLVMVKDVLIGMIMGILLWAMTRKMYQWLLKRVRKPGAAAGLALVATLLVIIIPVTVILAFAAADAVSLADKAQTWFEPYRQTIQGHIDRLSRGYSIQIFGYDFTAQDFTQRLEAASAKLGNLLITVLQKAAGGILSAGLLLFVTLYTLFFFYVDGEAIIAWLKRMLPLTPEQSERLIHDFLATAESSLQTVVVIGIVQGTLGGLAFWVVGIPSPIFWSVLIGLASAIPAVGGQIILVPASIIIMLVGQFWTGLGLLAFSWGVIGHVDNVLRPYLVKRAINLHQLLVLVSTLGGIAMFGFWGVILGPVIASLLKAVLDMYAEIYQKVEPVVDIADEPKK
jgi:predicted PurR-regulated permease PerM